MSKIAVLYFLLVSIMTISCTSVKNPETPVAAPVAEKRFVGELERLGKNGEDFLVLGVDAPGFDQLSQKQKVLVYYLYRAAIAGHTLFDQQNHRYALEIRNLLEEIHRHSQGL